MKSLYLSYEQSLRMKKLLARLEQAVAENPSRELNLYLARAGIYDLAVLLSPLSRSRKLLEEILEVTQLPESAVRNAEKVSQASAELHELYTV